MMVGRPSSSRRSWSSMALDCAAEELKRDCEFVVEAVKPDGEALVLASKEL